MYVQQIPGWEKGAKFRAKNWPGGEYLTFCAESNNFYNREGSHYAFERDDWLDNNWEPYNECPHCNGTGQLLAKSTKTAPAKRKTRGKGIK